MQLHNRSQTDTVLRNRAPRRMDADRGHVGEGDVRLDWWKEGLLLKVRIRPAGLMIALLYAVAYWATRQLSLDQFYLPAGIRVAAVLLCPPRLWPYLLLGEYAYFAQSRVPMIEKYGLTWVIVASAFLMPALKQQYPDWTGTVRHVVGIDSSPIRAARTGIRGGNDIVWVGRAANHAAKLTDLDLAPSTWITDEVFIRLADELKYGGTPPTLMWEAFRWNRQGGRRIHGSDWAWRV